MGDGCLCERAARCEIRVGCSIVRPGSSAVALCVRWVSNWTVQTCADFSGRSQTSLQLDAAVVL